MYNIKCIFPANREPWRIPLEDRLRSYLVAVRSGRKTAIMLYAQADTSTFRYRCYNVYQATEEGPWRSVYFFLDELETVESILPRCDLLVLTRVKWSYLLNNTVQYAKKLGIPVVYDVDDLVCNLHYLPLLTNTLNVHFGSEVDYDFWFAYISRNEAAAGLADGFITTNDFLGNKLSERFNKPYQIIVNSLNREQLEISEQCRKRKSAAESKKPFTIGYFSGTPSHINDFKTVYMELRSLLEDNPDMVLQVVGFMEFPYEMGDLINKGRIKFTPLVDFLELQRLIAQVDVNIVPLVTNSFTNCKSELKFFEAAVVDTPTLAAPIYTYEHAIRNGDTGFLCQQGEWYERILEVYKNPKEAKQLAARARDYCIQTYSGQEFQSQILKAYTFFAR